MKFSNLFTAALVLAAPTFAQEQTCGSDSIPLTTTNWSDTVSIPKFDPALGVLLSVDFELTGGIVGSANIESLDAQPSTVTTNYQASITLTRPDMSVLVVAVPNQMFVDNLSAFDGTIDFGGTSGITRTDISVSDMDSLNSTAAADLALFTGPSGAPGTIDLPIEALGSSVASGSGNLITQFLTDAEASVEVCYNYALDCNGNGIADSDDIANGANDMDMDGVPDECQPGIRSFCEGDGAAVGGGIDCPCNNNGNPGEGCDNGSGSGGLLTGTGTPSIANDTLVLTASQIPTGAPGLFFGSLTSMAGGDGMPFDQGLRCISSPIRILKLNSGGTIPVMGAPTLSAFLNLNPGDTTFFQYWYRNANGPCNGNANSTNGVEVTWGL